MCYAKVCCYDFRTRILTFASSSESEEREREREHEHEHEHEHEFYSIRPKPHLKERELRNNKQLNTCYDMIITVDGPSIFNLNHKIQHNGCS